jgi:hypothetical protein
MRLWQAVGMMIAFVVVICVVVFLWWDFDVRWRPRTITKDTEQITRLMQAAGWVSAGGGSNKVYVLAVRSCAPCDALDRTTLPALQKAGVDTRVIVIAPPDANGRPASTPAERSTVAELWVNRSWPLFMAWMATAPANWVAPNIPPADGDAARSAVVETSRDLADRLKPLLEENGVSLTYPVVVWRAKDGTMQAASGDAPNTWTYARKDLGAS